MPRKIGGARRLLFAVLGLALVIVVAIFGLAHRSDGPAVRSDKEMLESLVEHRADLDRLIAMLSHDRGLVAVDFDWTDPANPTSLGVTSDRVNEYRAVFKRIGLHRGVRVLEAGNKFVFIDRASGNLVNGLSKSFVHDEGEVSPVVEELDSLVNAATRGASYRSTGIPFWYLQLDRS